MSRSSPNQLFDTAASLAGTRQSAVLLSSRTCNRDTRELRRSAPTSTLVADPSLWRTANVELEVATMLQVGMPLMSMDQWAEGLLLDSGASEALTPSFHVPNHDMLLLRALLVATEQATVPQLRTHIPIEASVLSPRYLALFLRVLTQTRPRPLAFTFTSKTCAFGSVDAILGLRELLAQHPGSHIHGVEPLVAADALAHGAGLVTVGLTRSQRRPRPPSPRDGGGRAVRSIGWLPGLFLELLLELRSPSVYADWFAATESPWCDTCQLRLDLFDTTDQDKAAIGRHNAHAFDDFGRWLLSYSLDQRPDVLARRVVDALAAHAALTGSLSGTAPVVDQTLAALATLAT